MVGKVTFVIRRSEPEDMVILEAVGAKVIGEGGDKRAWRGAL